MQVDDSWKRPSSTSRGIHNKTNNTEFTVFVMMFLSFKSQLSY